MAQTVRSQRPLFITLGLSVLFLLITLLLFVLSRKILNVNDFFYALMRPWMQNSTLLLPAMMAVSAMSFFWSLWRRTNDNRAIRRMLFSSAVVFLPVMLTVLPMGNRMIHETFFHEHWMWLSGIWWFSCGILLSLFGLGLLPPRADRGRMSAVGSAVLETCSSSKRCKWDGVFLFGAVLWVVAVSWSMGQAVLGGVPHVQDSIAQYFQAKLFALGTFALPVPHHAESFERIYTVMKDGRWYSIYPPGHALLLALGELFRAAHWVNPLVSGITVWLTYHIAGKIFGWPTARFTVLLMMVSPFFIFMSAGWMNHPTALFFVMLFWVGLFQAKHRSGLPLVGWHLFAGFAFGMLFLTRPLTALAFLPFGLLWVLWIQKRTFSEIAYVAIAFGIGALPAAVFFLLYNHYTTGAFWLTGYVDYFGGNPLGFGKQPWGAEPLGPKIPNEVLHTPWRGVANTLNNLLGLNYFLFGFPVPALCFPALVFLPGVKRMREDGLCLVPLFGISLMYFFYFFQDYCYGPRFLYESVPFLCMLSARGILLIPDWMATHLKVNPKTAVSGVVGIVMIGMIGTFTVVWTERIITMRDDYWSTRDDTLAQARHMIQEEHALIFTELDEDFAAFFSWMDPRLDRGWIVAHDLGEEKNQAVMAAYPNVAVYQVYLQNAPDSSGFITVVRSYTKSVIQPVENEE